jgi:hypothetical protein
MSDDPAESNLVEVFRRVGGQAIRALHELFDGVPPDPNHPLVLQAARWLVPIYATPPGDEWRILHVCDPPGPCKSGFGCSVGARDDALVLMLGGEPARGTR